MLTGISIILLSGAMYYSSTAKEPCAHTDMVGNCLPEGMCAGPTDDIIKCEDMDEEIKRLERDTDIWEP